tara:strand:- start:912 stop:1628 length:717 start_codon:yes stop_codon:yes gene_type:complete
MKISVIICCYNGDEYVEKSLKSVFSQTLDKIYYDVIFVNDGSIDETSSIAKKYLKYNNFFYFENHKNLGLTASCNKGLEITNSTHIIRLDADDYIDKNALESFWSIMLKEDSDLIISDRYEIDSSTNKRTKISLKKFNLFHLISCGVMMKRNILVEIKGYRKFLHEEYDLYLRYLEHTKKRPYHIEKCLYYYLRHPKSMTHEKGWIQNAWNELIEEWGINKLNQYGIIPKKYISKNYE